MYQCVRWAWCLGVVFLGPLWGGEKDPARNPPIELLRSYAKEGGEVERNKLVALADMHWIWMCRTVRGQKDPEVRKAARHIAVEAIRTRLPRMLEVTKLEFYQNQEALGELGRTIAEVRKQEKRLAEQAETGMQGITRMAELNLIRLAKNRDRKAENEIREVAEKSTLATQEEKENMIVLSIEYQKYLENYARNGRFLRNRLATRILQLEQVLESTEQAFPFAGPLPKNLEWEPGILPFRKRLELATSFEFVDEPMDEVLRWFSMNFHVLIQVDAELKKEMRGNRMPSINLRVKRMNMKVAIHWVCRLAGVEYEVDEKAATIHIKRGKKPETKAK